MGNTRWLWMLLASSACSFDGGSSTVEGDASAVSDSAVSLDGRGQESNAFRRLITIDPAGIISADATEVAVPIRLTNDPHFRDNAAATGDDLVVVDSNGKMLSIDIEVHESSSGTLVAWVVIPSVTVSAPTTINLIYGDGQTNPQPGGNPWTNAEVVWHFDAIGVTPTVDDASPNDMDGGSPGQGSLGVTTGILGPAFDFGGAVIHVAQATDLGKDSNDSFTTSLWFNQNSTRNDFDFAFFNGGPSFGAPGWEMPLGDGDWVAGIRDDDANQVNLTFGAEEDLGGSGWHHLVLVVDRGSDIATAYLNGAVADYESIGDIGDLRNLLSARVGGENSPPNAAIDEFRNYARPLSANDVALDHALGRGTPGVLTVGDPVPVRYPPS